MTANGWLQIVLFALVDPRAHEAARLYMFRVFEGERQPLAAAPRARSSAPSTGPAGSIPPGSRPGRSTRSPCCSSAASALLVTYAIQRLQHLLPLNPQGSARCAPDLAFNTAVSFTTNTNWQSYAGESTMSYLTQMAGLAWHNFISAAAGIGVALALARGLTRRRGPERRAHPRQLLGRPGRGPRLRARCPLCVVLALVLVAQGVIQTLAAVPRGRRRSRARSRLIAMGPVASQEAIKKLGTNGGGFFNANSAHPFENPTPLTNFVADAAHLRHPGGAHLHLRPHGARPAPGLGDLRARWRSSSSPGVAVAYRAEARRQPGAGGPRRRPAPPGTWRARRSASGVASSALFATVTTDASCGAVNAMHDSFTPLGGLVPLVNIQLGEVIFGGVGAGLYGMLVFVAPLRLHRRPHGRPHARVPRQEDRGARDEARHALRARSSRSSSSGFAAWAAVAPLRRLVAQQRRAARALARSSTPSPAAPATTARPSPASTPTRPSGTSTLGLAMLAGRFLMIVPVLAIAGLDGRQEGRARRAGDLPDRRRHSSPPCSSR